MKNRDGLTLVSVMVAVTLLSVGIVGLSRTLGAVANMQSQAATRTAGLEIGRAFMEVVRAQDPQGLVSIAATAVNEQGIEDDQGPYMRSLAVTEVQTNLLQARVTVNFPRADQPVELVTYIYRGNQIQ